MASESLQTSRALRQRLVQVEAACAPAGPFARLPVQADHHRRDGKCVRQPGCHNPDHPRMPALRRQDDRVPGPFRAQHPFGLVPDARLQFLPFPILLAQRPRQLRRPAPVLRHKQLHRRFRLPQPPGGIDPGGQGKADGGGSGALVRCPRLLQQSRKPRPACPGRHLLQPITDDKAVLARQGHHIRHSASRYQVPVPVQHPPGVPVHGAYQLERHPHAG